MKEEEGKHSKMTTAAIATRAEGEAVGHFVTL